MPVDCRCACPKRLVGLFAPILLLVGCNTDLSLKENLLGPDKPVTLSSPAAAAPATALTPVGSLQPARTGPGLLQVQLTRSGNYYGWRVRVERSFDNPGFKPYLSSNLWSGHSVRVALWPGRYQVEVFQLGELKFSEAIEIAAGQRSLVYVDIGFLFSDVRHVTDPAEVVQLGGPESPWTRYDSPIGSRFLPAQVPLPDGNSGRWFGPLDHGRPVGEGKLEILEGSKPVATIETAEATAEGFTGELTFTDGRTLDRAPLPGPKLAPGTVTSWPNGREFRGTYRGFESSEGRLRWPDGRTWDGPVAKGEPAGRGRSTAPDGNWVVAGAAEIAGAMTGERRCGTAADAVGGTCYFVNGERVDEAGYRTAQAKIEEERRRAEAAVAQMMATKPAAAPQPAAVTQPAIPRPAASRPAVAGCAAADGEFVDGTGKSLLTLGRDGSGHLHQKTVAGEPMTFDIDFRWRADAGSISFDYDMGIYRSASGQVLRQMKIPGGTVECAYDGRVIDVGGVAYRRR